MSTWYVVGGIIVAMVVTFFTRVIPFPLQTRLANSGFLREFEVSLVFWTGVFLSPGRRIRVTGKETGPGPGGYG